MDVSKFLNMFNNSNLNTQCLYNNPLNNGTSSVNWNCLRLELGKMLVPKQPENCPESPEPFLIHSKDLKNVCIRIELTLFQFLFPLFLLTCLVGNLLSLKIYRLSYFSGAEGVWFLKVKAVANMGFMSFLTFEMVHAWTARNERPSRPWEGAYWLSRPYILFAVNFCAAMAIWHTVFITIATLICIVKPATFKRYLTRGRTYLSTALTCVLTLILHSVLLSIWEASEKTVVRKDDRDCPMNVSYFNLDLRQNPTSGVYEKIYFWLCSVTLLLSPNLIMLICSFVMLFKYQFKASLASNQLYSSRRRCVLMITFSTTICHLVLEGPSLAVFATAALRGSEVGKNETVICLMRIVTNFMSLFNATIPFFVYLAFNQQFRRLVVQEILCRRERQREGSLALTEFGKTARLSTGHLMRLPGRRRDLSIASGKINNRGENCEGDQYQTLL